MNTLTSKASDDVEAVAARIFEQARVCDDASYVMVPRFLIGKLREAIKAHGIETRAVADGWYCACGHRSSLTATRCDGCGGSIPPTPKASSEVFPCTHLGCNEPDGSKCRHWPRGSQKAEEGRS